MKPHHLLAFALALTLTACVEPADPAQPDELADPIERVAPAQSTESTAPMDVVAKPPTGGPSCANGTLVFYDWVCHPGSGWHLDPVGSQGMWCTEPYTSALVGRTGICSVSFDMHVCGTNPPEYCGVGSYCSTQTRPTAACLPPPPTPPGGGGGVFG